MVTTAQQRLPLGGEEWPMDDQTREIGRRGLAEARAALEAAARRAEERERQVAEAA
jgi:hypothetical protein